ncbi:hypothetical protein ASPZODRAFT_13500 [Penicilliopsis zonata CBS 506.65]|uniref:HNH nuclease domain-containing protein n=1 Tax=Penicilliopsis zonata CBS 506.65 TaxID=1073090 RepID=A0A1L9ST90_9EURO|nr:hypothetical protein ASPZODRAFT_13500 [Penicilliopsis zonata CBS 506.65]OJJ50420.1 hypothetical protein ASPZODRAFT_13500 [Penicilliopsis zonata CBS 506.65]
MVPPRRSARLEGRRDAQPPNQTRGTSVLSTDTETSQTLPSLLEAAKDRVGQYQPNNRREEAKLQTGLTAFLGWLPEGGRESVARDILSATTDDEVHGVFINLLTALAMPMKARSRTSSVIQSPHSKRRQAVESVAATLDEPEERKKSFRKSCMQRDGYCCVASGNMDIDEYKARGRPSGVDSCYVEGVHIIPFAYASWDNTVAPPEQTASAWEVLWRCFPRVRQVGMQVASINDLSNGITLRGSLHREFGRFQIAFKPTNVPNVYERKLFPDFATVESRTLPSSPRIEFTRAPGTENYALPSAALLDCHYRLAEILNASGMAEVIDEQWRRWEDLRESTGGSVHPDGKTDIGGYLNAALWERVVG